MRADNVRDLSFLWFDLSSALRSDRLVAPTSPRIQTGAVCHRLSGARIRHVEIRLLAPDIWAGMMLSR